jgi:lambda family phage portal protein
MIRRLRSLFASAPPPAVRERAEPTLAPAVAERAALPRPHPRAWLAAAPSRLLADLPGGAAAAPNREIRQSLAVLRARSRWLAQNDGFSKGFFRLLRRNVVGPQGFDLQMAVADDRDPKKRDEDANQRIEAAWLETMAVGACDVTGKLDLTALLQAVITGVGRDGEAIIRKVRGQKFNRAGLALQLIDPSQLPEDMNTPPGVGFIGGYRFPAANAIRMGVELSEWGRPVAYHLRTSVPNDDAWRFGAQLYQRVPAEEVVHLFVTDWPGQVRGIPWLEAGIRSLAMMDGYAEAELVAARTSANKMGFYKLGENVDANDVPAELMADGRLVQEAEAGTFELLPKGVEFESYDPQHPNAAFKEFVGTILRRASAGTGVSYNAFANDRAGLNYSALRAVALDDRDEYRTIQQWMISAFCKPFFTEWLRETLISGITGLPPAKFYKFNAANFHPRGWQWVDPQNEIKAAADEIALGLNSRRRQSAERGQDFDQTVADLKAEQEALAGLEPPRMPTNAAPQAAPQGTPADAPPA